MQIVNLGNSGLRVLAAFNWYRHCRRWRQSNQTKLGVKGLPIFSALRMTLASGFGMPQMRTGVTRTSRKP